MQADKYQQRALETWHDPAFFPDDLMRDHASMALACEAAEYLSVHLKNAFKPLHESTRERRLDELCDVFYYVAVLAALDDCTIDELSQMNHEKLNKNGDNHGWKPNYYRYAQEMALDEHALQPGAAGV
jgi:hypothetical protein